jgi:hypothetical protein
MRRLLGLVAVSIITVAAGGASFAGDEIKLYGQPNQALTKVAELLGHEGQVLDAIYLPDGSLMTAGADGTIRTWDLAAGKQLATVVKQSQPFTKLMVGLRRDRVLAFSAAGPITVWQLPTPKRPWGPEQAVGPPDSGDSDQQTAWASETPDGQEEWLLLEFDEAVAAKTVRIHENYNPGAVIKITAYDAEGKGMTAWSKEKQGEVDEEPPTATSDARPRDVPLAVDFAIKRLKLHIDSPAAAGWNEIDAVGLVDAEEQVHWATAAAASSTYSEQQRFRQPRVRIAPPPVYKIPAGATELSHVDDTAEGKQSFGGSGHAVQFHRPREAPYVVGIEIFGSRYGYPQPPDEDFEVVLLDEELKEIKRVMFPYAMFERGKERWVVLGVDGVEVPRRFHVALNFNAHQTKGVYVGKDENVEKSHSLVGTTKSGFKPVDNKFDWMIRVHVAKDRPADMTKLSLDTTATNSAGRF